MTVATYPVGQCTYYVASRFPAIYGYMGNAKEWVNSALKQGYPVSSTPIPNSVAVYGSGGSYSADGHVAVVDSVNGDGTFNVSEMNFRGFNVVDQRRSTMANVIGFVVPPGSMAASDLHFAAAAPNLNKPGNNGTGAPCITTWNFPLGANVCMDGIVGGAAMAGGGLLMLGSAIMLVALAMHDSGAGRASARAISGVSGLAGAVVRGHQEREASRKRTAEASHQQERQTAAESHQDAMRRANVRTARARARGAEARARIPKQPTLKVA